MEEAFCLGDTVDVTGNVKAYNGTAIQDVPLTYTVTRRSNRRYWGDGAVSLVSDTVQLDAKGNFSIPVVLKPDTDADNTGRERFSYQIEVAVTSDTGETQTSHYFLNATRRAYFFVSDISRELCKEDSISGMLSVMNAVNETLSMEGMCRLYPVLDSKTGKISDKPVYESAFMPGEKKDFTAWKQLPSGEYRLILSVRGRDGKEVSNADNAVNIVLFSLKDERPAVFMETFLYEKIRSSIRLIRQSSISALP